MDIQNVTYLSRLDGTMQPALFVPARSSEPRPLAVCLHTWSADLTQNPAKYFERTAVRDWHCIYPLFRGPNWTPEACGSDLVVSDLECAVEFVRSHYALDEERIYLVGGSGGGHGTLLLAGRRPDIWAAASAWCPISDVAEWHRFCKSAGQRYDEHIRLACGGDPQQSEEAFAQAMHRSPVSYLAAAKDRCIVDIGTGIHDGHRGSVPVSQSVWAFNLLAEPEDRIAEEDIEFMVRTEKIPEHLRYTGAPDPAYGPFEVLLRRTSALARLTLFEGAHDLLPEPAFGFLERQRRGAAPVWASGDVFDPRDTSLEK